MNDARSRRRLLWLAALGGVLLLAVLFVSLAAPSPGDGNPEPVLRPNADALAATPTPAASGGGFHLGGQDLFSLAWRLGLVALVIAVSIVGLRWWGKRTSGPRSVTGFLRVVDTLAISNGRSVHLVCLGRRVIAVGATAQQLTLLNELTDEEAAEVLAAIPRPGEQPLANFATELFRSIRLPAAAARSTSPAAEKRR
ncbi:MAG: flagellar biosynthetic protein FliO [Dehalococcoidia bacterium]|nr:flagellar biosynthetic protein FliO [Dehalococcoidia bacterium]